MADLTRDELLEENARLNAALARLSGGDADKLVSEKLAKLAHALGTPLNAIIGFAELLRDGAITEPKERDDALSDILSGGQRLLQLINGVIEEARKQSGVPR